MNFITGNPFKPTNPVRPDGPMSPLKKKLNSLNDVVLFLNKTVIKRSKLKKEGLPINIHLFQAFQCLLGNQEYRDNPKNENKLILALKDPSECYMFFLLIFFYYHSCISIQNDEIL